MELSQQEYWSQLPFPPPGNLSDPGIKPASPALAGRFFIMSHLKSPSHRWLCLKKKKKKKKAITLSLLFSIYIPHQSMTTHLPSLPSRKLSTIPDSAHSSPFLNPVCTRSLSPNKLSLVFQIASDFLPQLPLLKYLPFDVMH